MTPANIVGMAMIKGLDVIAVTDHNSCKNCPAVTKLAKAYGIIAIPGMELCTIEDIHVLCLFESLENAMEFDTYVSNKLINVKNDEKIFGEQLIYDEEDNIIGKEEKALIYGTEISFENVYEITKRYKGIMIPAHIDKKTTSLLASYGFIPEDSKFTCVELKNLQNLHTIRKDNSYVEKCNVITNSDAHYLEYINEPINMLYAKEKNIKSILEALEQKM